MDSILDLFKSIGGINALAGTLGIGVVGLLGVAVMLRRAVTETIEAFTDTKAFIEKYKALLTSDQAKADLEQLKKDWDDATESIADVLDKLAMKSLGDKLRKVL